MFISRLEKYACWIIFEVPAGHWRPRIWTEFSCIINIFYFLMSIYCEIEKRGEEMITAGIMDLTGIWQTRKWKKESRPKYDLYILKMLWQQGSNPGFIFQSLKSGPLGDVRLPRTGLVYWYLQHVDDRDVSLWSPSVCAELRSWEV